MEVLTAEQMRNVDRRAIETLGIPSLGLMEAAGRGVAERLLEHYPDLERRGVVVLCGKGNNGGDGLVAARHLHERGLRPAVLLLARAGQLSGDAAVNLDAARQAGVAVQEVPDASAWGEARARWSGNPVIVDAILGTGVRGGARGLARTVIEHLAGRDATVVAVDLPSGLDADSGKVEGGVLRAERTYTLCRPKLALVSGPAVDRAGIVTVVPIGIPDEAVRAERPRVEWTEPGDLAGLLRPRGADTHKGSYGHLLAVAGSRGKSGAAVLLARGALRSGICLVTVATPAGAQAIVAAQQAEMMVEALPETTAGALGRKSVAPALRLIDSRDALVIGPGLGTAAETRQAVMAIVRRGTVAAVVDADGLNAFAAGGARAIERLAATRRPLVLTPHPGEAARLLDRGTRAVQRDRIAAARKLARATRAVVVLKGHRTVVAAPSGRVAVNSSGNPGMATGGTGDVLTGIVGSLLARGLKPWDAARLAVYAHGAAGDRAAAERGQEGLIASDLLETLPLVLASLVGPE